MKLFQIPARQDNYIYLALGIENQAFVVDPAEAEPVRAFLTARPEIQLKAIVNTHHHFDHVGGNEALKAEFHLEIFGPAHDADRIPGLTHPVSIGDELSVCGISMKAHDVRAHTRGHICFQTLTSFKEVYRSGHAGQERICPNLGDRPALFVGDSLFLGGCGRLFEGTPRQLYTVMQFYRGLAGDHLVACGHEYTESNLRFAAHIFPDHESIVQRLANLPQEKGESQSSVPDLLEKEFQTNPFFLVLDEAQRQALKIQYGSSDGVQLMGMLRSHKDNF